MSQEPVTNISNFFHAASASAAQPQTNDRKRKVNFDSLLTKLATADPEAVRNLTISATMLITSLVARRKIRQGLVAAGVESSAAKAISLAIIYGAYAIGANAATGVAYANYFADTTLYPNVEDAE